MKNSRSVSTNFISDLKEGVLLPILERVRNDDTLMLAIRGGYINIYYRGGNLLKVVEQSGDTYGASFDENYGKFEKPISGPAIIPITGPKIIKCQDDANEWVSAFALLKQVMDLYFSKINKSEREFQQLVARENNYSTISNESEYFVSDIEFADTGLGARLDMLSVRWLASQRKSGGNCRAVLVEMKYGDKALEGTSGLIEHIKAIHNLVNDEESYKSLLETMESQFNQLDDLALLNFNRSKGGAKVRLDPSDRPEVVILLANHNPRSTKLATILKSDKLDEIVAEGRFELKFFVSSFSGYGLHSNCMHNLDEFRKYISKYDAGS